MKDWQATCAASSSYDLDRIILNVWREYRGGFSATDPTQSVRHEVELLRTTGLDNKKELSLMPLYYAARALNKQKELGNVQLGKAHVTDVEAAQDIVETLVKKFEMDGDRSTRKVISRLQGAP